MSHDLAARLLNARVTVKAVQHTNVGTGTLRPTYKHVSVATDVPARFDPINVSEQRGVMGNVPKGSFRLFLNVPVPPATWTLDENYQVVRQSDSKVFHVSEVLDFNGHHLEAVVQEVKA